MRLSVILERVGLVSGPEAAGCRESSRGIFTIYVVDRQIGE